MALLLESCPNQVPQQRDTSSHLTSYLGLSVKHLSLPYLIKSFVFTDDSLNFGVSTLEEIRLRKALKASMKRAGYPLQTTETSTNVEKENIQTFFRPDVFDSRDGKKCKLGL